MKPRPFHRWKSLWFGVLVLAFLGWAWIRSMGHRDEISWAFPPARVAGALQSNGRVMLLRFSEVPGVPLGIRHETAVIQRGADWFPPARVANEFGGRVTRIEIPHWLLILLFLIPWTAFLLWRGRRLKRLAARQEMDRDG